MNRDLFKKALGFQMSPKGRINDLTVEEQRNIMKKSIEVFDEKCPGSFSGYHNILIVQEELAELQQELSKALRSGGTIDTTGLLEELADVSLAVDYVKEIFNFTDEMLHQARTIKMRRVQNNLTSESNYR